MPAKTKTDWGIVYRYRLHDGWDEKRKVPVVPPEPVRLQPAYFTQLDRHSRIPGLRFTLWDLDPEPESPEDPRRQAAEIAGAESLWLGDRMMVEGWVEGENGKFEDWGSERWHRERWLWLPREED